MKQRSLLTVNLEPFSPQFRISGIDLETVWNAVLAVRQRVLGELAGGRAGATGVTGGWEHRRRGVGRRTHRCGTAPPVLPVRTAPRKAQPVVTRILDSRKPIDIVTSSAGTGKAFHLVGEIEKAIDAGAATSSIIGTTYTNKTGAELVERTRLKLFGEGKADQTAGLLNLSPSLTQHADQDLLNLLLPERPLARHFHGPLC